MTAFRNILGKTAALTNMFLNQMNIMYFEQVKQ